MQKIITNLEKNLKNFFQKRSIKKAVLGVSGGVDSAVTLKLAVNALGKENVFALLMPYDKFSSSENLNDALKLVKKMKVDFQKIELSPFIKPFLSLDFINKKITKGNTLARLRMNLLYAAANEMQGMVLGTCNKTEILIGFFTKFGDGGADLEVIGDLWKSEVFTLAESLDLKKFAHKKPTAELWDNHFDEQELGLSYQQIDQILKKIIKTKNFKPQNLIEKKVLSLFKNSEHKRITIPVIKSR